MRNIHPSPSVQFLAATVAGLSAASAAPVPFTHDGPKHGRHDLPGFAFDSRHHALTPHDFASLKNSSWSVDAPVAGAIGDGPDPLAGEPHAAGLREPPGPPAAVPEPGAMALFAGGLLAMAGAGTFRPRRRGGATPPPRRTLIGNMRYPAFILAILLGAATVQAAPILVTLGDPEQTGIGPLSFIVDTELQPLEPYDFDDYFQYTGDYVDKQDDYSIQLRDYYRVEMDDANGFGYNWHLESSPPGIEFSEKYTHIRVFNSLGQTLDLQTGPWPDSWNEGTVFYGFLYYDIFSDDRVVGQGNLPIVEIRELATPAIPEPASLALFALGLGAVAGMAVVRSKRQAR